MKELYNYVNFDLQLICGQPEVTQVLVVKCLIINHHIPTLVIKPAVTKHKTV